MKLTTRRLRHTLAALFTAGLITTLPGTAHAAPFMDFQHDATGTSSIASTGSTINLGPTTLTTTIDLANGHFSGTMPLPGTTTRFEVAGFIPVTAKVDFVEAAPLTGHVNFAGFNTPATGTASYYIKLSNIKVVGFPTFTGPICRTKQPVTIPVNTPEGESFNLIGGGHLTGEYTIGNFQNCGLNTWLINLLIPGSGNTVDINVTGGTVL